MLQCPLEASLPPQAAGPAAGPAGQELVHAATSGGIRGDQRRLMARAGSAHTGPSGPRCAEGLAAAQEPRGSASQSCAGRACPLRAVLWMPVRRTWPAEVASACFAPSPGCSLVRLSRANGCASMERPVSPDPSTAPVMGCCVICTICAMMWCVFLPAGHQGCCPCHVCTPVFHRLLLLNGFVFMTFPLLADPQAVFVLLTVCQARAKRALCHLCPPPPYNSAALHSSMTPLFCVPPGLSTPLPVFQPSSFSLH